MAFSYEPGTDLGRTRLLVGDTNPANFVFSDDEVNAAIQMTSAQGIYASGQFYVSWQSPQNPVNVTSVWRAAAMLLDTKAAVASARAGITELLDVKLSLNQAATELRAQADCYRQTEMRMGHVAIAETIYDQFGARERIWKVLLRLEGG